MKRNHIGFFAAVGLAFVLSACDDSTSSNGDALAESSSSVASSSSETVASSASHSAEAYCQQAAANCGTFTDYRDGREYRWTKIGTQIWLGENLDYSGDDGNGNRAYTIGNCPGGQNVADTSVCNRMGRHYRWVDVMVVDTVYKVKILEAGVVTVPHQGICPAGWHVPRLAEWETLLNTVKADLALATAAEAGEYLFVYAATGIDYYAFGNYPDERYNMPSYFWTADYSTSSPFKATGMEFSYLASSALSTNSEKSTTMFVRCVKN